MAKRTQLRENANDPEMGMPTLSAPSANGSTGGEARPTGIVIPRLNLRMIQIRLVGDTPLIVHQMSEKSKQMMLEKHMKKATNKREAKDPEALYRASLYLMPSGGCGFPAVAFKSAAVGACRQVEGLPMTLAKRVLFVRPHEGELVAIDGSPTMREDRVRNDTGVADIRYRGEFWPWAVTLVVEYNADVLSGEQVVNLFSLAGFGEGVGEWRPSSPKSATGNYGRWHVAGEDEQPV